jgi:apolipoprotein N-acyltransferase
MVIDAYGRVLQKAGFGKQTWLTATIPQGENHTFYTKHGNWFGYLIVILAGSIILIAIFRKNHDAQS